MLFALSDFPNSSAATTISGRVVSIRKPAAGQPETIRIAPGETLDFSQIANENITLVKLGTRLVVLFPDKGYAIVDGFYVPGGQPSSEIQIGLDPTTTVPVSQFVAQFPISADQQILTAAGITGGLLGSGAPGGFFSPTPFGAQPLSALTPGSEGGADGFVDTPTGSAINNGATASAPQPPVTSAFDDAAFTIEAGVNPGNTPFAGTPGATGSVVANDTGASLEVTGVAPGDTGSASGNVGTTVAGTYGSLVLNADGSYTYALDNADSDTNRLAQGETVTEIFTYSISDGTGGTSTAKLVVTVTGTNDAPVISSTLEPEPERPEGERIADSPALAGDVQTTLVVEAGFSGSSPVAGIPSSTGRFQASDVDNGATLTWTGNATGTYGSFSIDPVTGQWTYVLDNADPDTNALQQGQVVSESFTVTVTDEFGATDTATVLVRIIGTGDRPVLDLDTTQPGVDYQGLSALEAARSTAVVGAKEGVAIVQTEDGVPSPASFVLVSDPEGGNFGNLSVSLGATATGSAGTLFMVPNGVATPATNPSTSFSLSGSYTAAEIQTLLTSLRYVNTEQTFALDIADRRIDVTLTDSSGLTTTATARVPVIADVRDTTGLDSFTGTRFDDRIEGMGGADTIRAGDGDDTLVYRAGDGTDILLDGGNGTDTLAIYGTDGDPLAGISGDDVFLVRTSGGTITELTSGGGSLPAAPNVTNVEIVTLDGLGLVNDTLSYDGNGEAVAVDLAAGSATGFQSIAGIENITGGLRNDRLFGDSQDNRIEGGAGDDVIDGREGDNTLLGGDGDDTITSGSGTDTIDAGEGDNTVEAGEGDNTIRAGSGGDTITSGSGADDIVSGGGDDVIQAGGGDNTVNAGDGGDTITTGAGDDRITTGSGDDRVTTGGGNDTIVLEGSLAGLGTDIFTDFVSGLDQIEIDFSAAGSGLAVGGGDTGALDASRFVSGSGFTSGTQRFLFNTSDNTLYYDADGNGAAAAIALAVFENGGTVTASDIRLT